jgi:hypothetical protein
MFQRDLNMDATNTGNPSSTVHDLGDVAAKIRDEIRFYLEAANLAVSSPEEAQDYEEAMDSWNSPIGTKRDRRRVIGGRHSSVPGPQHPVRLPAPQTAVCFR